MLKVIYRLFVGGDVYEGEYSILTVFFDVGTVTPVLDVPIPCYARRCMSSATQPALLAFSPHKQVRYILLLAIARYVYQRRCGPHIVACWSKFQRNLPDPPAVCSKSTASL